jgi:heme exporter protein C
MMVLKLLLFIVMAAMIVVSFLTVVPQRGIGEASRIFYYHVPMAWVAVLAFGLSTFYAIRYLRRRNLADDDRAVEAARLGFVFCLLATVTGSIFAKVTWGSFWNWDPRETSVFILLLIYAAYFALRGAVEVEDRKAALSAAYSIFAFMTVPFLVFVVPRVLPSLHPSDSIVDADMKFTMDATVGTIFGCSLAAFTALSYWIFNLGARIRDLARRELERDI